MNVRVWLPPLDHILDRWPSIADQLRRATSRTGCYEPIDVLRLAFAGQVGIWVCESSHGIEASFVTEVKQYPRKRILEMLFCGGGNMTLWLPQAIAEMDRHATATGCAHIACVGRKGWARAWGGEITDSVIVRSPEEPK